ncbi:MAG: anti-sigma factor family protein [Lachnospiraceae bacterium]
MTCAEAESMVMPYIRHELQTEELEGFLEHIEHCASCREELEIYYIVDLGIKQLDGDTGTYNIKGAMERSLELCRVKIQRRRFVSIVKYAVNTLCVLALFVTLVLQCRIWWQAGIF